MANKGVVDCGNEDIVGISLIERHGDADGAEIMLGILLPEFSGSEYLRV